MPDPTLGDKPAGFSSPMKQSALTIKARIQSGENIPLEELRAFILSASLDLTKERKVINKVEKKSDVDFF